MPPRPQIVDKHTALVEWSREWFQYVLDHSDKEWDYDSLSSNPNLTWEVVHANSRKPWNYKELSNNPNITWEIVQANPDIPWNYEHISKNPNITWDIVQANPDKPWDYANLSDNPNITWDIIQANPDKPWSFMLLSKNENITLDIIQANPDKPWNYFLMAADNPNITWEIVQANPDEPWDYDGLCINSNITWEIVQANPDKPWDYEQLSQNPNMTWDIVAEHRDIEWDFVRFSTNPNLTWEIVDENPDVEWDYIVLSENEMTKAREAYIRERTSDVNINKQLLIAAVAGNVDVVRDLIARGADVNTKNSTSSTVLILAVVKGHVEIVDMLIKAGADINIRNEDTSSALILAAFKGHVEIVDMLIKAGANLNAATENGDTALMFAASKGHSQIVELLLKAGADYTIKNRNRRTALTVAKTPEIKALIKSYMPKIVWKGFTDVDMDKFKTIFETEAPPGRRRPAENYSCCPICLAWIERSEACMYMKHNCSEEGEHPLYHQELYDKFQENGLIQWCTICGRICSHHLHYNISDPHGPKPSLIETRPGIIINPYGTEADCMNYGGGGLTEKLTRFRMLRKEALELQKEVGNMDQDDAFNDLVEACWSGTGDIKRRRNVNLAAKNFREVPSSSFPPEPKPATNNAAAPNNAPNNAPNVLKPTGIATTKIIESNEMDIMGNTADEGNPMLEITYEDGYTERVTKDTLKAAIQSRITSWWEKSFGYCLMYPECRSRLYPSDIRQFVEQAQYETYRKRFNEKFARANAGAGAGAAAEAEAEAAVGGRRVRKTRKNRKTRKVKRSP